MNLPFFIYCVLLAILVGSYNYRHLKASRLHRFLPFLVLTLAVELVAYYLKYFLNQPNGMWYNGYVFFQVLFCIWFFRNTGLSAMHRRMLDWGMAIYIIATLITYTFYMKPEQFSTWLFLLGGFIVALAGLFFLFSYFLLDNNAKESILAPVVAISIGFIAYFSVLSITVALINQILVYNLQVGGIMLHNFLPRMMSIILYLCFAYAFFICRKPVTA